MTLTELSPELLPSAESAGVIDRFAFTIEGQEFLVDIANGLDPRVPEARKIEEDTFAVLGDIPEEVQEEFDPHDSYSRFIFMHATDRIGEPTQMVGMGRLIPYNIEQGGLKTFVDLGKIAAQKPENGPDDNRETRIKILDSLGMEDLDVDNIDERADLITKEVESRFSLDYPSGRLNHLVDIATLAPDMNLEFDDKLIVIEGLLASMGVHVADLYEKEEITHLIQFTAGALHHYLRDLYGYPIDELFGLSDLSYDSFGNGGADNMVSTPSVLPCKELIEDTLFVDSPVTDHIGRVGSTISYVRQHRI
jgi:hypothetical protein